jgi:hypothetical protein
MVSEHDWFLDMGTKWKEMFGCIENPSRGEPLKLDDPRLLAIEAYITSTRKGVALEPGKH